MALIPKIIKSPFLPLSLQGGGCPYRVLNQVLGTVTPGGRIIEPNLQVTEQQSFLSGVQTRASQGR